MVHPQSYPSTALGSECLARLRDVRHVVLDMDGTIYEGENLFDETLPFLKKLEQLGLGYTFVTNNSSLGKQDYLDRLRELGVSVSSEQLHSSTDATLSYLKESLPEVNRLYVLGTERTRSEFRMEGFHVVDLHGDDQEPDAVVVGFDTGLGYHSLCRAAYWIGRGKPFLATHPDAFCPTDEATVLVDCGAICAALTAATGRVPDAVLGKPDPRMLKGILTRYDLQEHQLAVVGDRLYTDIEMARRAGAFGVLVLTGDSSSKGFDGDAPKPDLVAKGLHEFGEALDLAMESTSRRSSL